MICSLIDGKFAEMAAVKSDLVQILVIQRAEATCVLYSIIEIRCAEMAAVAALRMCNKD